MLKNLGFQAVYFNLHHVESATRNLLEQKQYYTNTLACLACEVKEA